MIMGWILAISLLIIIAVAMYLDMGSLIFPIIGLVIIAAVAGILMLVLTLSSEPESEQCPEGQVEVREVHNNEGASGCVPHEMLMKTTEKSDS